jgi:hypothetical protein
MAMMARCDNININEVCIYSPCIQVELIDTQYIQRQRGRGGVGGTGFSRVHVLVMYEDRPRGSQSHQIKEKRGLD